MEGRYNVRSPAVKRLMKEAQELSEPTDQYFAQPLEDNLFEWHFTVRGPADSDFQNGIYHGRIILPVDYPMKPPSIIWLTPNGRFETNKKICLSISGHHPESWQPSWSIRTALLAIIGFMPTHPGGAIGSLDYKPDERKVLAKKSQSWKCPACGDVSDILLAVSSDSQSASNEAKELAAQISFQGEKPKSKGEMNSAEDSQKNKEDPTSASENKASAITTTTPSSGTDQTSDVIKSAIETQASSTLPATSTGVSNTIGSTHPTPTSTTIGRAPTFSAPASSLPPSGLLPSPWNANSPFQPYNFYPGQNAPHSMPTMPLRFPYPPSYYTMASSFYPPGCAFPPGVGMFPCPFPPTSSHVPASNAHSNMISVNNSSVPNSTTQGPRAHTSVSYTRTPMSCPSTVSRPQACTLVQKSATNSNQDRAENVTETADRKQVLNELLIKVKRVGSDEKTIETPENKETTVDKETCVSRKTAEESGKLTDEDVSHVNGENIFVEPCTDSEVSKSLKKTNCGGDETNSEVLPSDTENSEVGVPPLEVSESEQKSALEKSTCNSTSELERWKGKQPTYKGLRQRQSATASVNTNTDAGEVALSAPDPPTAASGQRIEADSGDSFPRNVIQPGGQVPSTNRVRQLNQETVRETQARQSSFHFTFFLMVVLLISTVGILLNRILRMYWGEDFSSSKPV